MYLYKGVLLVGFRRELNVRNRIKDAQAFDGKGSAEEREAIRNMTWVIHRKLLRIHETEVALSERGASFSFDPDGDLLYDLNELALDFQWIYDHVLDSNPVDHGLDDVSWSEYTDRYLESLYEMASTHVFTADTNKDTVRFIWIP